MELTLTNGEKIFCPKADGALNLEKKVDLIKRIVGVIPKLEIESKGEENE